MLFKYALTTLEDARSITAEMALSSETNMNHFRKLAQDVKRVAPKSDEFTYFVCRAIHAMEATNYDPVTKKFAGDGHLIRRGKDGNCSHCGEAVKKHQDGLWHSGSGIEPYVNQNGDAFPEEELLKEITVEGEDGDPKKIKAYETFVGRGLFVNHASDDAEKIRGIVLDARWDPDTKGVDILVACDKVAYPELARQIEAGYSNDVSMGTQVQYSLCSECGNKAVTEDDYCDHVKEGKGLARAGTNKVYEINNGLNFIEISVVSNGADPKAKIRSVVAMLQERVHEREASLKACINPTEAENIRDELRTVKAQLDVLVEELGDELINKEASGCSCQQGGLCTCSKPCNCHSTAGNTKETSTLETRRRHRFKIAQELNLSLPSEEDDVALHTEEDNVSIINGGKQMSKNQNKKAYFLGAGGLNDPSVTPYDIEDYTTVRDTQDKHMVGQGMEEGNDGLHSGYDSHPVKPELRWKEELLRAKTREDRSRVRRAILQQASTEKEAYYMGGGGLNDPEATPYDIEDYTTVRDTQDKHMVGQGMEPGNEGLHPGYDSYPVKPELRWKEELKRAKLRARFVVADTKNKSYWTVFAGTKPILQASAEELYPGDLDKSNEDNPDITNWDWVASEDYGLNIINAIKQEGYNEVKAQIERAKILSKTAQEMPGMGDMGDMGDEPMPGGDELDLEGLEGDLGDEGGEEELNAQEQINTALAQIEDAVREIRALNEGDEADVDSLETELDLGEAGAELEGLDEELGQAAASGNAKLFRDLMTITKQALTDAQKLVRKASGILGKPYSPRITRFAEDGEADVEQARGDLEDAEKALNKGDANQAKKEVEEAEHELEEVKAGEEGKTATAATLLERKAARYKLAAELYNLTDSDMVAEAHPDGGTETKAGEESLEGDSVIETETEQQEADMEVAERQPRGELTARQIRRRKLILASMCEDCECDPCECPTDAEASVEIPGLDVEAKEDDDKKAKKDEKPDFADLDDDGNEEESAKEAADDKEDKDDDDDDKKDDDKKDAASRRNLRRKALKGLKSEAEVDAETKSYWSELFAESSTGNPADPECKGYAGELTQDYATEKKTAGVHQLKTRFKRAYRVALKQAQLGQLEDKSQEAVEKQVDRLMNMDTPGFEAFEEVIEATNVNKEAKVDRPMKRTAGAFRVGMIDSSTNNLESQLSKLDWS